MKKTIKPTDFFLIFVFLLFVIFSYVSVFQKNSKNPMVVIQSSQNKWIYDLSKDGVYKILGDKGETIVCIKNKKVSILDSPCPNKTCVASIPIYKSNQWLACLPNNIVVFIEGNTDLHQNNKKIEIDAFSF